MAPLLSILSLALLFFSNTLALQISSDSPCAALCLDPSSPNSTTSGNDVVCVDNDFSKTDAGKRYMSCVSCLQTSTATYSDGNDQEWFLYNLRYALDTCLFAFTNSSDSVSSPCATDASCGPLRTALEDGNLIPSNTSEYGYCSADNKAFLGDSYSKCMSCLQDTDDQIYFANFLVALQAGCSQQAPPGTLIGLQGTVFSTTPVNITYAGYNPNSTSTTTSHKSGLPQGALIGIVVGIVAVLTVVVAVVFICYRKQRKMQKLKNLRSPLDSRFGAKNITSPQNGAYGNPYSFPPTNVKEPLDSAGFTPKELVVLNEARSVLAKHQPEQKESPYPIYPPHWEEARAQLTEQLSTSPTKVIPTHQAYIPPYSPISPTESADTNSTTMKSYASSHSSPKHIPPSRNSPKHIPSPIEIPQRVRSPPRSHVPPPIEVPQRVRSPPRDVQTEIRSELTTGPTTISPYGNSPHYSELSQRSPPTETSRIYSRPMHSQTFQKSPPIQKSPYAQKSPPVQTSPQIVGASTNVNDPNFRPPPRTASRAASIRSHFGLTSRQGVDSTFASSEAAPVKISGPIITHGGRFDFELAERERREREKNGYEETVVEKKRTDDTPISAGTDDLW